MSPDSPQFDRGIENTRGDQHRSKSQRAQPRDAKSSKRGNRHSTLPDLRFLHHNKPAPTPTSLLDPDSKNGADVQQYQALQDAEAWYTSTATLLKERLALCERLRDGLGEVNALLRAVEVMKKNLRWDSDDSMEHETVPHEMGGAIEERAPVAFITATGVSNELEVSPRLDVPMSTDDNLKLLEDAIQEWLKDIRIARAKWIAGGRDMENRIGLR